MRLILAIFLLSTLLAAPLAHSAPTTPTADFIDNGDGTVTHKTTGLIWKRCAEGQTWAGGTCSGTAKTYTWAEANALSTTRGWRLPDSHELAKLVERDFATEPMINTTIFPSTPASNFWSASESSTSSEQARYVRFSDGGTYVFDKTSKYHVRLVRNLPEMHSAPTTPSADFIDNGDGTVTHKITGLIWKRCAEGQTWAGGTCTGSPTKFNWDKANALKSGDWRLPTIVELSSIVERDADSGGINATVFPKAPSGYWAADFGLCRLSGSCGAPFVRLVRGGQPPTPSGLHPGAYTPTTDFTDNRDGTVTHKKTNLTWKRCEEGQTWTGATCSGVSQTYKLAFVARLKFSYAGFSD